MAAYSVVANDSIQTLGTFLSSNSKRNWLVLWAFAGSILAATLIYGWFQYSGDVSYGRLAKYALPDPFAWFYLLPPLILVLLTRTGIPVSTSFLILTFFNEKNLMNMVQKSLLGYAVAFGAAIVIYIAITRLVEKRFIQKKITDKEKQIWTVLQWCSTGFLWSQWLIQDFANIYVYLPREISALELIVSLAIILGMLAYIVATKGGAIQKIVKSKTNTIDIRSATIIDAVYGMVLFYFKEMNEIPMSTTWVFIGLLAGREIAINFMMGEKMKRKGMLKSITWDLTKVTLGLVISILLVFIVKYFSQGTL
jgi:zinc transporter ZupT